MVGWEYNEFSEPALSELGFSWWCRDWMPRDVTGTILGRILRAAVLRRPAGARPALYSTRVFLGSTTNRHSARSPPESSVSKSTSPRYVRTT